MQGSVCPLPGLIMHIRVKPSFNTAITETTQGGWLIEENKKSARKGRLQK
jgi:hypothetical protein